MARQMILMLQFTAHLYAIDPTPPGAPLAITERGFQADTLGGYTFPGTLSSAA